MFAFIDKFKYNWYALHVFLGMKWVKLANIYIPISILMLSLSLAKLCLPKFFLQ